MLFVLILFIFKLSHHLAGYWCCAGAVCMPDGSTGGRSWYTRHPQHPKERYQLALGLEVNNCQGIVPHLGELVWLATKPGAEVIKTIYAANYCLIHNVNNWVGSAKASEIKFCTPVITWSCAIHLSLSQHIRWSCPSQWQSCLLSSQRTELPSRIDNTYCCSRPTIHTHPNVKVFLHCGFNPVRRILTVFYITWKPKVNVNYKRPSQTSVSVSGGTIPAWIVLVYAS